MKKMKCCEYGLRSQTLEFNWVNSFKMASWQNGNLVKWQTVKIASSLQKGVSKFIYVNVVLCYVVLRVVLCKCYVVNMALGVSLVNFYWVNSFKMSSWQNGILVKW